MTSTAVKTNGLNSTGNTAHLNLTVTLAQAWGVLIERHDKYVTSPRRKLPYAGHDPKEHQFGSRKVKGSNA